MITQYNGCALIIDGVMATVVFGKGTISCPDTPSTSVVTFETLKEAEKYALDNKLEIQNENQ